MHSIKRYDLFDSFDRLFGDLRLFDREFFPSVDKFAHSGFIEEKITDTEVQYVVEVPGVKKADASIVVDDATRELSISVKKNGNKFVYSTTVNRACDTVRADASLEDGILIVKFPKAADKRRVVEIK